MESEGFDPLEYFTRIISTAEYAESLPREDDRVAAYGEGVCGACAHRHMRRGARGDIRAVRVRVTCICTREICNIRTQACEQCIVDETSIGETQKRIRG